MGKQELLVCTGAHKIIDLTHEANDKLAINTIQLPTI